MQPIITARQRNESRLTRNPALGSDVDPELDADHNTLSCCAYTKL